MSNFFYIFFHQPNQSQSRQVLVPAAGSCISVWVVPAYSDWRSSKYFRLAGKGGGGRVCMMGYPSKTEPITWQ